MFTLWAWVYQTPKTTQVYLSLTCNLFATSLIDPLRIQVRWMTTVTMTQHINKFLSSCYEVNKNKFKAHINRRGRQVLKHRLRYSIITYSICFLCTEKLQALQNEQEEFQKKERSYLQDIQLMQSKLYQLEKVTWILY